MNEQLPYDALRVVHPICGCVLQLTDVRAEDGSLLIEAICYRCDKYVHAELKTRLTMQRAPAPLTNEARTDRIADSLKRTGSILTTARELGIARTSVYRVLRREGIVLPVPAQRGRPRKVKVGTA